MESRRAKRRNRTGRRIHLDDGEWVYRIGNSYVVIISPKEKRHNIPLGLVIGATYSFDSYDAHPVCPSDVRRYINRNLTNKQMFPDHVNEENAKDLLVNFARTHEITA